MPLLSACCQFAEETFYCVSACDENPWLALKNCFYGLMFLSKMWALMWSLFLGFRGELKMGDVFEWLQNFTGIP